MLPDLSPHLQAFLRAGYGCLLLLTLVWALPHWRRFFMSERWRGYAESKRSVDAIQNPIVMPLVLLAWLGAAVALTIGRATVAAALVNLILCRYFFVAMRWNGVLRGMGAPGLMTYWLAAAVFLLEYTRQAAPELRPFALLVLQIDLAFIIGSAGLYKLSAGYVSSDGMDLGLVNPQWGYWWRFYRRLSPGHWMFRSMNHAAWSTEILAAVLMVAPSPAWRAAGGLLLIGSFAFVATQIRLAWLAEMMILCGLLFMPPGHAVDRWIAAMMPAPAMAASTPFATVNGVLGAFLVAYLALLPLAHAGLFYNFYARKALPGILQVVLERYTNLFGIMIWRVFSADHLNFFVRIHEERAGTLRLLSRYGSARALRFAHVAESIAITSIFTTLKYYASNARLFETRLLRYARTIPVPADAKLVFEYVAIEKAKRFEFVPAVTYTVSPRDWSIAVRPLVESFSVHAAHQGSPVHEGRVPGSYAPAR